jgi:carboxyl-terminal processing protease
VGARQAAARRPGFFRGREFVFGRIDAGETKMFAVETTPGLWLNARTEAVMWHFFVDGGVAPGPFTSRLQIKEIPHPRFAFSWQIVDDGSGQSRGNGDGLIQPGEEIDLVIVVKNIGVGATADLWQAAQGGNEDDKDDKHGFVRLKNRSGEALFLTEGSSEFSLQPGESSEHRLHFRVESDVGQRDTIEAEITVGDARFMEIVTSEIEVPIFSPSDTIGSVDRKMKPKGASAPIYGGASEHGDPIASVTGVVQVDGRLGQWFRTKLPWGTSGWIAASQLVPAARGDELAEPTRQLSHSPPVVQLFGNLGGSVVVASQLTLSGSIVDDSDVRDLFVFVNDKKVSYSLATGISREHPFELTVDLIPGDNRIEIFARDDQDHIGSLSLGVYRESATAAAPPAPVDSVIR